MLQKEVMKETAEREYMTFITDCETSLERYKNTASIIISRNGNPVDDVYDLSVGHYREMDYITTQYELRIANIWEECDALTTEVNYYIDCIVRVYRRSQSRLYDIMKTATDRYAIYVM